MTTNNYLWQINERKLKKTNLFLYSNYLKTKLGLEFGLNFNKLLQWSIKNPEVFWKTIWDFSKIKGKSGNVIIKKSKTFYKNKFFPDSKINYAENLIKKNTSKPAIIFKSENGFRQTQSWKELNFKVGKISNWMTSVGVKKGDRIAAYLPNIPETVLAYLGTTAIGAIWSSCSPDFGINGVVDRFSQIKPKILFIGDKYFYNGKKIVILNRLQKILKKIPSITKVVVIKYPGTKIERKKINKKKLYNWDNIIKFHNNSSINFTKFSFNDPLAILYSSGTTGKPKCICHSIGGVLLQHNKELLLHCDVKENDRVFYFTTCGWMMWNWLVGSLALGATICLFDGFPFFKKNDLLFEYANKEKITLFGVSAKYIDTLKNNNIKLIKKYNLSALKTICSTGSPLSSEGFKFIYKNVKKDVHLASISGGTDIVSCFVLGNVFQKVYDGEIQNCGLGMDVDIFNEKGISVKFKKGELVCKKPFPSMPIKFWNDKEHQKYSSAYFKKYKNVWHHGDFAKKTTNGGFIIYGRSDATLNPGGVRLGTAEIYNEVENFIEIKESITVGQSWKNDIRIILFIVLNDGFLLNTLLVEKIKKTIKNNVSPRHVPSKIIPVSDIPKTKNGKLVELTVKKIIEGEAIKNLETLANPDSLEQFKNIKELYE